MGSLAWRADVGGNGVREPWAPWPGGQMRIGASWVPELGGQMVGGNGVEVPWVLWLGRLMVGGNGVGVLGQEGRCR